jgi:dipeptidyl aminopeptidase/acylaminoacyl peptidase
MNTRFISRAIPMALALITLSLGSLKSQDPLPPVTWQDVAEWKYIAPQSVTLSENGQWLAYWYSPNHGDAQLILQHTTDTIKKVWEIGEASGFGRANVQFNGNSSFLAFTAFPTMEAKKKASRDNQPQNKVRVVRLSDMEETEFESVRSFSFSGENPAWMAIHLATPKPGTGKDAGKGTDMLLYNLELRNQFNFGNVASFSFNKSGKWLAWIVDATGKAGNGIMLRSMDSGEILAPESDKAVYKSMNWTQEGDALAVLKAVEDKDWEDELHSVIGFRGFERGNPTKVVFNPADHPGFPEDMTISPNRGPFFAEDLNSLFFGVHSVKMSKEALARIEKEAEEAAKAETEGEGNEGGAGEEGEAGEGDAEASDDEKKKDSTPPKNEEERPDLVLWHWEDTRLQSVQQNREQMDKNFNHLSVYHIREQQFVQLGTDTLRMVMANPWGRYAIGFDTGPYELDAGLSGQNFRDIWVIDTRTGQRKMILEALPARGGLDISPDGNMLAYFEQGDYYTYNLETDQKINLTENLPTTFINQMVDVNVDFPPTPYWGWTHDSRFVVLRDNHDVWRVAANGRSGERLTLDGAENNRVYQMRYSLEENEKGIDFRLPFFMNFMDQDTKRAGLARIDNGRPGARVLLHDDAIFGSLSKAKNAQAYIFTRQTVTDAPDYHVSFNRDLNDARKLTETYAEQANFAWSPGSRLISFVSDKGDTLQAAIHLPAGYEEGKSYPTVVYIYERLTQGLNAYNRPSFPGGGWNRSMYTSNGYAVLMPDISYTMNDPGMSAVWCVLPALDAAIETGIVDAENVAIHGHSWGGYQTSFLITQTDRFKASVAGAPLTNMISMYSLIYWNTGGTNQAIFESSQGRLTSGYWDNWEAYKRNSPVYYAAQVNTPLLLMHNDKDGAVDFTQGVEYYNTLRRLRKPVVMLQYKGENHGLRKQANQIDYAMRMMEFLDHYLKGAEAPDWYKEGVPHLEMEKHLENRPPVLPVK